MATNTRVTTKAIAKCGHSTSTTIYGYGLARDQWLRRAPMFICNKCFRTLA